MARTKPGLHKEISAIFGGVPIPKDDGSEKAVSERVPGRVGYVPLRPAGSGPQPPTGPESQAPVRPLQKPAPDRHRDHGAAPQNTGAAARRKTGARRKEKLFTSRSGVSPARQKVTTVVFLILLGAVVFLVLRPFVMSSWNPTTPPKANPAESQPITGADINIHWQTPPVYSTDRRDPMTYDPDGVSGEESPESASSTQLIVRGIVCSEEQQYAIIGTQIVKEGETVLGAKIVQIREEGVEFEKNGETWTQKVEGEKDNQ
jgi:hypothetical protein